MTRNFDQRQATDTEAAKQSLFNRGIPYSNDPNSRYQQEMKDITNRYDQARQSAQNNAVQLGGQEWQRGFGIGLQGHQQQLSDIGTLQQQGTGLMMPQGPGFQGTQYQLPNQSSDIYTQLQQLEDQKKRTQLYGQSLAQGQEPTPPAFNTGG